MRNLKLFQNVLISCVIGSVITVFHFFCVHALGVVYSTGILAGGEITRPASSGRGGCLRGIFGIVQHHSSLVQDAFFPEVWPHYPTNHFQGKGDYHALEEMEAKAEKNAFLATSTLVGMICHPACDRLNIYKWPQWLNIEPKSFSQQQVCVSWAQSPRFNKCLCAKSYNMSLSLSFFRSIIVRAFLPETF